MTYYHLLEQNNKTILDETGRLIEIIYEMANLDRNELYAHLKYFNEHTNPSKQREIALIRPVSGHCSEQDEKG